MSSIVPRAYPGTLKPKLKYPSYRAAIAWIAEYADVETTRDVHMTVRLVASVFGRDVQHVLADVVRRRKER